eukprot:7635415-Alexandrium_andersonii.AAC.1
MLELDHDPAVVISDDEASDGPESDPEDLEAMWPAQRRVAKAARDADDGGRERDDSSSDEPDWGGSGSESGEETVYPPE